MAKRLAILTWDSDSVALYARQVREFLGEEIDIETYSVQGGNARQVALADVYLVSTCAFADRDLAKLLPGGGKVVISEVRITREGLRRLMEVSRNTKALLVNINQPMAKELFAQAIHAASPRAAEPFVAINCAAIPDSLLEGQLFGYEEGSFTGARKGGHIGFFEAARRGTLFLDEIEAMSPMLQVKLLRVLQEKEIIRLGGVDVIHVDVRVIAATNEDLPAIVRRGAFRKDLFYRLSVLPLQLPPLRNRGQDVRLLLDEMKEGLGAKFALSPAALQLLIAHSWDGNVRELRNCVEYLAYLDKPVIAPEDLPPTILATAGAAPFASASEQAEPDREEEVLARLRRRAGSDLAAYAFVLAALCGGASTGRKSLAAQARAQGVSMTEQTARTALTRLKELGLVEIRRGRGGSRPTLLGRAVSQRLEGGPGAAGGPKWEI